MNENLDLTKILEGCPKGTEFYHSGYGRVWFIGIDTGLRYPIHIRLDSTYYADAWITSAGTLNKYYDEECLLFPSKDQRDWSKFERFWDKPKVEKFDSKFLRPFDKVLVRADQAHSWNCDLFSHINVDYMDNVICVGGYWETCIPYNDETKHLVGTRDDCPDYYKWWEK